MAGTVAQFPLANILESLEYGSAMDSEAVAKKWIAQHESSFGYFIDSEWVTPDDRQCLDIHRPSTGETLAKAIEATAEDVERAMRAASEAYTEWADVGPFSRAKVLYSIARNLQKHQSLLAVVEALDTGMPIREARNIVVPSIIRQFYHFAGWAQLISDELPEWTSIGVTAVFSGAMSPLVQLAERVAPALAAGNSVIIMPSSLTCLSAFLFADICAQSGVPAGLVNVLSGSDPRLLASHAAVGVVTFAGLSMEGRGMRQLTAGTGTKLSLDLRGHCSVLVFEEADLDSAVESVVDAAFSNSGQNSYSASRLLVQQPVYQRLLDKLKTRMAKLTIGDNLDKNNDQGSVSDPSLKQRVTQRLEEARAEGAEIFQACSAPDSVSYCLPPTLVTGAQPASQIYVDEPCGPVLVTVPFRTEKEAIAIANHGVRGTAAGVWTENINVALEVATQLHVATVWINSYGLSDAACGRGGSKASGFGRCGGKESLYNYMRPAWQPSTTSRSDRQHPDLKQFGTSARHTPLPSGPALDCEPSIDKTYKLFYSGSQKRPDSGASLPVKNQAGVIIAHVPDGGKKDVRNAVEAALKSVSGWSKKDGHGRAQILYYMAENLMSQRSKFVTLLTLAGIEAGEASGEVDQAVERLFYWAAHCDKYGGTVQESVFTGQTVSTTNSLGVIAIVCPESFPLLAFVSLVAPAIARGNSVVVVPSSNLPLPGLAFHQILETSDVPAGVVNILTGDCDVLTRTLAQHNDVASVWYFSPDPHGSAFVEKASADGSMKRTWTCYGSERDFGSKEQGQGEEFLIEGTFTKTIWMPMGDVFAN